MKTRFLVSAIALTTAALALAGCSSSSDAGASTAVRVVASTNVYGDIAEAIGGETVDVTSLMDDPAQDPHSFEASAQNRLAVSKADIVIENGGGYDDFMTSLVKASPRDGRQVLDAVKLSGLDTSGEFNEHVWYDFPTMQKVTDALVAALSKADASHAAEYRANGKAFSAKLAGLEARTASLRSAFSGEGVAITEPVPLYLLDAIGLVNKTPPAFSEAIEAGDDVSPVVLEKTLKLLSSGSVQLLAYNEQTTGPQTERVLAAAKNADVPVVPVTETLPSGTDYIGWMDANIDAVKKALSR